MDHKFKCGAKVEADCKCMATYRVVDIKNLEAIVAAARAVRAHGTDYRDGTHAKLLWDLVDDNIAAELLNNSR